MSELKELEALFYKAHYQDKEAVFSQSVRFGILAIANAAIEKCAKICESGEDAALTEDYKLACMHSAHLIREYAKRLEEL